MIESVILKNEGSYDATGTELTDLKALNFVFGSNGSGKTTISRVIADAAAHPDCSVKWGGGNILDTRVYNRDFVERHFDGDSSIKGIYTFGENVDLANRIKELKSDVDDIAKKLTGLRVQLNGEDGAGGKQQERANLETQLRDDVWKAKVALKDLSDAFTGLNNSKQTFFRRYLEEAKSNTAELRDVSALQEDAKTIFSGSLFEATKFPLPSYSAIVALELDGILSKKIIGKGDVDIAALIERLGNSDWVLQGRQYFNQLENQCPFCQQKTDAAFREQLEEYFDETYVADLSAIDNLAHSYESACKQLLDAYAGVATVESLFLDRQAFEKELAALRLGLESNLREIGKKRNEPSAPISLISTKSLFEAVEGCIRSANEKIEQNNDTYKNLHTRKSLLIAQVWKRLLEDTKSILERYRQASGALDKAITNINAQIQTRTEEHAAKQAELEDCEQKITSIKPTIDAINKLLKSFGFINFSLAESAKSGFYEVRRPDGSDAKRTLSEGEKSFITFLYFYSLVRGSFSAEGATTDRIVVFDDPVSSLDADILFIVCNLIKDVISEMCSGGSTIKQVFVLTHNIYFHKEVTFNKDRSGAAAFAYETFWILRKNSKCSELVRFSENPIKSSYELLWREVRRNPPSDSTIQNSMRRILEYYFKFLGGQKPERVIEVFDGHDKIICGSLLSWLNDGSHHSNDDLFIACDPGQIGRYKFIFQKIFEESGQGGHYRMMMGEDYVEISSDVVEGNESGAGGALGIAAA